MPPIHGEPPRQNPPLAAGRQGKLIPDPIRASPHPKLIGCGPNRSYRHLHHQRGTVGTFRTRLLEGRGLRRRHWSALSLGPARHLGLSRAHGEVSSFGTLRLAFWRDGNDGSDDGGAGDEGEVFDQGRMTRTEVTNSEGGKSAREDRSADCSSMPSTAALSESSPTTITNYPNSMPSMPMSSKPHRSTVDSGKSPMTPLFDQGCIRTLSPAPSPLFPLFAEQNNNRYQAPLESKQADVSTTELGENLCIKPPSSLSTPPESTTAKLDFSSMPTGPIYQQHFGQKPPDHYAKEQFKSSTVSGDSNPIWGDAGNFLDAGSDESSGESSSTFCIPLQKDDLRPALRTDGGRVGLEVRLDEEMSAVESLLVGGALSTAVGAATAATSVVGMGRQAQNVSSMGMEMLGLGTDRLIGRGYVDLMPLLLGLWDEDWEQRDDGNMNDTPGGVEEGTGETILNEIGRIDPDAHKLKRRVERMGMLDVWVPLYHPTATTNVSSSSCKSKGDKKDEFEMSGKVHLLISYEPNGMTPKREDAVAFESFARRPLAGSLIDGNSVMSNIGPIITPIVPPLSPLLVIETCGPYLLLEYAMSRTVTSVDRTGNVKSSRWDRMHRVRVHRHSVFVIERRTLVDALGDIARLPCDIALSTSVGREIAEVSAPIVTGAMELAAPALVWGKLMMAAGGTSVRAGLAGARAATGAVVAASQEKALERRDGGDCMEGEAGIYAFVG